MNKTKESWTSKISFINTRNIINIEPIQYSIIYKFYKKFHSSNLSHIITGKQYLKIILESPRYDKPNYKIQLKFIFYFIQIWDWKYGCYLIVTSLEKCTSKWSSLQLQGDKDESSLIELSQRLMCLEWIFFQNLVTTRPCKSWYLVTAHPRLVVGSYHYKMGVMNECAYEPANCSAE